MLKKLDTVFHTLNWLTYLSKKLKCSQRFYPLCHLFVYLFFNTPIYKTDTFTDAFLQPFSSPMTLHMLMAKARSMHRYKHVLTEYVMQYAINPVVKLDFPSRINSFKTHIKLEDTKSN